MAKPAFLSNQRLSRFMVSLLLCVGLTLPVLVTLGITRAIVTALLVSIAVLSLMTVIGSMKKGRLFQLALLGILATVQFFLPNLGLFGSALEAFKAIELYFKGIPSAVTLFSSEITVVVSIGIAMVSYMFSNKGAGFVPAAMLVVLVLFGILTLGKPVHLWYALPAILSVLLLVSQTTHEKINLFEVLPMAAIVVLLGMLILPQGNPTIPPLYSSAMKLKQTITDYLFFTEERNVFTLGAYGYYPMGNTRLGGEVEPSNQPVMIVKTDERTLLRAVVKDEYTGRSWRDTSSGKRYLYIDPRWSAIKTRAFLTDMPAAAVLSASDILDQRAISVQIQNTATSSVFTPVFLRNFSAQSDLVGYFNDASELFITRDLAREDAYTVFAPIFEGGDNGLGALVEASPKGNDKYYQSIHTKYTTLPSHLEEKVYSDARDIVASAATPYEKAMAIMRHLQRYYRYTLTPATPPENQDFVAYFLYTGKEGYCTYYASAMTVLCRMVGLPSRFVEGFVATPSSDGMAYVTGLDAHAWTEVYFEGFGWIPFDATPNQQNLDKPQEDEEEPEPSPSPSPSPSPEPSDEPENPNADPTPSPNPDAPDESEEPDPDDNMDNPPEPDDENPPSKWWLWLLLAAAIVALCAYIRQRMPNQVVKRKADEQDKIFVYGSATYLVIKLLGRNPRKDETPLLFARRMDRQKAFPVQILPLWRMMALSSYSKMQPRAEQTARAKEIFERMYKPQSPILKLRFMFKVAFGKDGYSSLETKQEHVLPQKQYNYITKQEKKKGKKAKGKRPKVKAQRPVQKAGKKQSKKSPVQQTSQLPEQKIMRESVQKPQEQQIPPQKQEPSSPQRRSRSQRNKD